MVLGRTRACALNMNDIHSLVTDSLAQYHRKTTGSHIGKEVIRRTHSCQNPKWERGKAGQQWMYWLGKSTPYMIWEAKKNQVASMLCLDMLGVYDHVSHTRLLHILKCKGCPDWLLKWIESMLRGRTTTINLNGWFSRTFSTKASIPQGGSLS